jgi:protein phosphatase PTC2/3
MGSGASSSYDASSQAALMGEMRASYETLAAQSSNLSDIELYSEMQAKYVEITTINNDGNLVNGVIKDKIPQLTDIAPTKHPSPILRMDSVAGEIVEKVEESGIDDEDDEGIDTTFNTGAAITALPTSTELLNDMINEQVLQDTKIAEFMGALKGGNVKSSKSSQFRVKRLTYAQKTIDDPEPRSPEKMLRARTTIYKSSEIGVTQEKKAPFNADIIGTFSCHGIEPGVEPEYIDDEDGPICEDDDDSCGPAPHDKINQDRGCVVYPFVKKEKEAVFLVLDGHGEQGDKISEFVMRQLVVSLEKHEHLQSDPAAALIDCFTRTNMALMVTPINYMTSGTTCVCCYIRDRTLFVANCGDSRAVMAVEENTGSDTLKARDLSRDHKPDDPEEQKRIEEWGGFIRPAPEPGLSARVYLDEEFTMIGLAMARSIGDFAVKAVGVIPQPEVTQFEINPDDQFMIMASDGVWEFIESQEAVDIVQAKFKEGCNCTQACQELIEQASSRWAEEEGDYRDDITCIVVKFPLPFQV